MQLMTEILSLFLQTYWGASGIIYCLSKADCEATANSLQTVFTEYAPQQHSEWGLTRQTSDTSSTSQSQVIIDVKD